MNAYQEVIYVLSAIFDFRLHEQLSKPIIGDSVAPITHAHLKLCRRVSEYEYTCAVFPMENGSNENLSPGKRTFRKGNGSWSDKSFVSIHSWLYCGRTTTHVMCTGWPWHLAKTDLSTIGQGSRRRRAVRACSPRKRLSFRGSIQYNTFYSFTFHIWFEVTKRLL